jgi:hypothetical protein
MNTPAAVSTGLGCLLLCAGVLSVTPGCSGSEPFPDADGPEVTDGTTGPAALPDGGHVINEYVLQVRPREHTTKLVRLKPGVSSRPGFNPQSVDSINVIQDDAGGTGPAESVELNTTNVTYGATCPGGQAASFCGTVVLGSFYSRTLNNVFVQVTSITDTSGNPITGHSGINSDAAPSWLTDSGLGLWKYKADNAATAGVIGTAPNNFGTRTWSFANPDDADTNILLRVVATLSYKDYTRTGPTTATWVNNCGTGTNDGTPASTDTSVTLPFGFTFYNIQNTTTGLFNRDGVATLGGVLPPSGMNWNSTNTVDIFKSTSLPENPASVSSSPGIYVFWDELNYNSSASGLCHGVTGTAPNRQFTFTWRNLKGFSTGTNKTNLNFSVILTEGTDTIDMVYGAMSGAAGAEVTNPPTPPSTITNVQRAQGAKAVIGVQGPNGATNISTPFPASAGKTPIPLSGTTTNIAYRYTPIP